MVQQHGFRPFNAEEKAAINLINFYVKTVDPAAVTQLREQIEQGMAQRTADLRLQDMVGADGRFDRALRIIDGWPNASTKLFGREDVNLRQLAWQAMAEALVPSTELPLETKAALFDKLLAKDSHNDSQTAPTTLDMLHQLGTMGRISEEEKRESLYSFFEQNSKHPPCFAFIGLLSLIPLIENLGGLNAESFTGPYVYHAISVPAGQLSQEYHDKIFEVLQTNSVVQQTVLGI